MVKKPRRQAEAEAMPGPGGGDDVPAPVSGVGGSDYCWTCRFYMKQGGLCRRFPPTPFRNTDGGFISAFPGMAPFGSCGEHKPAT